MVNKINLVGHATIYANEFNGVRRYSTYISKRNPEDGTYDKMFLPVQLPKGDSLVDKTEIDITTGFLSFYKDKNGIDRATIVVIAYVVSATPEYSLDDYTNDLPF